MLGVSLKPDVQVGIQPGSTIYLVGATATIMNVPGDDYFRNLGELFNDITAQRFSGKIRYRLGLR